MLSFGCASAIIIRSAEGQFEMDLSISVRRLLDDLKTGAARLETSQDHLWVPEDALRGNTFGTGEIEWDYESNLYFPQFTLTIHVREGEEIELPCWGGAFLQPGQYFDPDAGKIESWTFASTTGLPTVRNGFLRGGLGLCGEWRFFPEDGRDKQEEADQELQDQLQSWIRTNVLVQVGEAPRRIWFSWSVDWGRPVVVESRDAPRNGEWSQIDGWRYRESTKDNVIAKSDSDFAASAAEKLGLLDCPIFGNSWGRATELDYSKRLLIFDAILLWLGIPLPAEVVGKLKIDLKSESRENVLAILHSPELRNLVQTTPPGYWLRKMLGKV